ncbi:MAG: dihydroorotate dehydrogenase-like protein [Planctomycetes bacterium]|nr:dihydroorotate dehydrogenase-like protein [Planctomycetota bacterium]
MTIDLKTTYLGLELPHPFMPGASPLVEDLDQVRRLEDAGAAAIVMHSLFEEQIERDQAVSDWTRGTFSESNAEARSYFPSPDLFPFGPDGYLEHLRRVRAAVRVPVIASLNGVRAGRWLEFAQRMEQAGAHALELNVYELGADPQQTAAEIEERAVEMVRLVCGAVKIPVAVKLSPFYTSVANVVLRLVEAGAKGVVLFNRFYQPDIDVDGPTTVPTLHLSGPGELLLRLRWLAILSGRVPTSFAVTGGVHSVEDAVKSVMAGAHAVQMVSALLLRGAGWLKEIREGVERWLVEHEYESLGQMRGSMDLARCPQPQALERANYAQILQSLRGGAGVPGSAGGAGA